MLDDLQGVRAGRARRPTSPATGEQKAAIRAALAGLGIAVGARGDKRA